MFKHKFDKILVETILCCSSYVYLWADIEWKTLKGFFVLMCSKVCIDPPTY